MLNDPRTSNILSQTPSANDAPPVDKLAVNRATRRSSIVVGVMSGLAAIIVVIPLLLLLLRPFLCSELYFALYPGIDTRYAPDYSESAFNQISTGMIPLAVEHRLGRPLFIRYENEKAIWNYTDDGKCSIRNWTLADFAWLDREVVFEHGTVVEVRKEIRYN